MRRLTALTALLIGLLATAAVAASGLAVTVKPKRGTPRTTFRVSFRPPQAAGHSGVVQRSYEVTASRPGRGCVNQTGVTISSAPAHTLLTVPLSAGRGRLCGGLWHGQITESTGPYCAAGTPCPEFASRLQTLARFSFRVTR